MKLTSLLTISAAAVASVSAFAIDLNGQVPFADLGEEIPGGSHIQHCSNPRTDKVEIKRVCLEPYPPVPGGVLHFEAEGIIKERIEEGAYIRVDVIYNKYIRLIRNQKFDFCENVKKAEADVECPIEEGPLNITKDVELPKEIPPGTFIVTAYLHKKDDSLITCLHTVVSFKR
ncbi:Phosphatidylglycerol/phosphatidylinositol transfer protein [Orbilia brochopaga]|uniref:Phosphatidylglycerol/phosphatidylinositol transfer protein n=1 Tax=Orbilia brochopaga TaxID=3140254 RepID=A0AAV9U811_9PEZI